MMPPKSRALLSLWSTEAKSMGRVTTAGSQKAEQSKQSAFAASHLDSVCGETERKRERETETETETATEREREREREREPQRARARARARVRRERERARVAWEGAGLHVHQRLFEAGSS